VRLARAAARHLEQRRRLRFRDPRRLDAAARAFVTAIDRLPAISRLATGDVGVYSVPLLDRAGDVVEHALIAIDFGRTRIDRAWLQDHGERLRRLLIARARARQRRVSRWSRLRAERLAATERALQTLGAHAPELVEAGLFDRREIAQAAIHREITSELDRIADARVDEYLAGSLVVVGSPVLELLLVKRA
jgi:hypothetical protein